MKNKKSFMGFALAGLLLAVIIELILAAAAAERGYGNDAVKRTVPLRADSVSDYIQEGNTFLPSGSSPSMVFKPGQTIGFVDIYFSEPLSADTDVILYYLSEQDGEEAFDRFKRVSRYLVKGTVHGRIPLPSNTGHQLRLDIRGSFVLERLEAGLSVPLRKLTVDMVSACMNPLRLILLAVVLSLSLARLQKKTTKKKKQIGYVAYLDAVRVIAAFLVIAVHVVEPLAALFPKGSKMRIATDGGVIFFLTCNLLFIFLSGALLLPYREETMGDFFRKRILRVLLPLVIYSFFYLKASCASVDMGSFWIFYSIRTLLSGQFKTGPHLWLVYKIIGVYLAAIPLRYMLRAMTEKNEKQLTAMIFIFMGLDTFSSYTGMSFGFSVFLSSWPGVFIMGYMLTRDWMGRYHSLLLTGGFLSFLLSVWLSSAMEGYQAVVANCSVLMLFMASSVFVLIQRCEPALSRIQPFFTFISRYSYSILLIHWFVLNTIIYNGLLSSSLPPTLQVAAPIALCFLLSLAIAMVVDHTVLALFETGIEKGFGTDYLLNAYGCRKQKNHGQE